MSKRKLLLADDSITIQKVVNLTFADEGIEVITVGDGDSAMQIVGESRPDLVLADVHMPGLSGYQVCEQIRANDDTNALPVLLLVGSFEPFDENEAERVGANGFMTKPFQSIRELVSKVSELMDAAAGAEDSVNGNGAAVALGSTEAETAGPAETDVDSAYREHDFNDSGDIDELYKESVGETAEPEAGNNGPASYLDAGMDDEMIEARYLDDAGGFAEPAGMENESEPAASDEARGGLSEPQDSTGLEAGAVDDEAEPAFDHFPETERMDPSVVEGASTAGDGESDENHFGEREPSTTDYQGITSATTEKFEFDDLNLLELPPVRQAETTEITTPQDAAARGGAKQLVTLSPELLDVIVQRVIDKLSERK